MYLVLSVVTYTILALGLLLTAAEMVPKIVAQADVNTNSILPPGSKPYGKTYGEWSAAWWQWTTFLPADKNPSNDNTGKYCAEGQTGPVWFLGSTPSGASIRTCSVPSDRGILFPVITNECSTSEYPQYKTESDLRKCAKEQQDKVTSFDASIDGRKIPDLQKYRTESPLFRLNLSKNNIFGTIAGPTNAVSDGIWLLLSPLPPGKHEIRFSSSAVDVTSAAPMNFASIVVYHLNVIK
jgi:hypothetical protein